jgi:succinate-semialdehyde dehydrogenase/glutarate-semialdehyde dehydrogenase
MAAGKQPSLARLSKFMVSLCDPNTTFSIACKSSDNSQDPATGQVIGSCAECDADDTHAAIEAASTALSSFRKTTGRERARLLRKWYDLMVENSEDIAKLITWENGKPLADAKGEAAYAASFFEWFSEEAPRTYGDTIPATVPGNRVWTVKEPVGVCGLITP